MGIFSQFHWFEKTIKSDDVCFILGPFRFAKQSQQHLVGLDSVWHCQWQKLSSIPPRSRELYRGNGFDQFIRFFVSDNPGNIFQLDYNWRADLGLIRDKRLKVFIHLYEEYFDKIDRFKVNKYFVVNLKLSNFFLVKSSKNWFTLSLSLIIFCQQPIESVYCIDSNALITAMKSVNQTLSTKSLIANDSLSGYSCTQFCAANGFQVRGKL